MVKLSCDVGNTNVVGPIFSRVVVSFRGVSIESFSYTTRREDVLVAQLYSASVSPEFGKRFSRMRLITSVGLVALGLGLLYFDTLLGWTVVALGVYAWFFYERRLKKAYNQQLSRRFREQHAGRNDEKFTLSVLPKGLSLKSGKSSSVVPYDSIADLVELPDHYLLHLPPRGYIPVPKQQLEDAPRLRSALEGRGVVYKNKTSWKWA